MFKAYKYRIYPTKDQIVLIEKHFGSTRFLYNYFLEYRQKAYAKGNKKVGYMVTQAELTKLKKQKEYEWLNECGSQSLQMALRDLDSAYSRFFRKKGGYPKFKSKKHTSQSFTAPQYIKVANNYVYLPKFTKDGIKVKLDREIPNNAVLKQNNQYFVSILIDDGNDISKPTKAKSAVGLDMGLTDLIITSDGKKYDNNKYFAKSQQKLIKLQRRLSKKKKGSNNRHKAKLKVQKLHTKIRNQRKDTLHKISNEITNRYDIICLETLNVRGLQKNKRLAKGIADVAWSEFMRQLAYKAQWKGKTVLKIDQWFPSSQICSNCGTNTGKKELHVRKWGCPECHAKHDRDVNAAVNIKNYGLGQIDQRNTIAGNTVGTTGI